MPVGMYNVQCGLFLTSIENEYRIVMRFSVGISQFEYSPIYISRNLSIHRALSLNILLILMNFDLALALVCISCVVIGFPLCNLS